jgi:iron-sulfur cluster assembly accessory protein
MLTRFGAVFRHIGSQASQAGTVKLMKSAVSKLESLKASRGPVVLRLRVESGGCGGFSYHFDVIPDSQVEKEDRIFLQDGQKVVVDDVSMSFLKDCEIDYHEEMVRSSFRVAKNAMADSSCGCGSSFSVGQ